MLDLTVAGTFESEVVNVIVGWSDSVERAGAWCWAKLDHQIPQPGWHSSPEAQLSWATIGRGSLGARSWRFCLAALC